MDEEKLKNLLGVRDRLSAIIDLDFIMDFDPVDTGEITLKVEMIAEGIRGVNYRKEKLKMNAFVNRQQKIIEDFEERIQQAKIKYETLKQEAIRANPGKEPSIRGLNRSHLPSVDHYEKKRVKYNRQREIYNQYLERARLAEENYNNTCNEYKNFKADFEEKLSQRQDVLETAVGHDVIGCMDNLNKLASRTINSPHHVLVSVAAIFTAKKVYYYFSNLVSTAEMRMAANQVLERLDFHLDYVLGNHKNEVKEQLLQALGYFNDCYVDNQRLFELMENELNSLRNLIEPGEIEELLERISNSLEFTCNYQHIVNPDKLKKIEEQLLQKKMELQAIKKEVNQYSAGKEPDFQRIAEVEKKCSQYHGKMKETRTCELDKLFFDIPFIFRIFDQQEQEELLWKHMDWLQTLRQEMEEEFDFDLKNFIGHALETGLLYDTAAGILKKDPGLRCLSLESKLIESLQRIESKIQEVDEMIEHIKALPQQMADEAQKKLSTWLIFSLFPLFSITVFIWITNLIRRFQSALSSNHSSYVSLRDSLIDKFQIYLGIHVLFSLLSVGTGFLGANGWGFILAVNYMSSSVIMGIRLRKIKKIKDIRHN